MLTMKKLQNQIKDLQEQIEQKKTKQEKIEELEKIFNKIREYFKNNIDNKIFIQAIDLTDIYTICSVQSKGTQK